VYDAGWTLVAWNQTWAALMGDPSTQRGRTRNLLWRHFTGKPGRVVHTDQQTSSFETEAVADLRSATARYPNDDELHRLVADLNQASDRFAELWQTRAVAVHTTDRKLIHHPEVGPLTLDCDVLTVQGTDLRIIAYTAEPGSEDADRLALLRVIGLQTMSG
jgi:hypothetical protein